MFVADGDGGKRGALSDSGGKLYRRIGKTHVAHTVEGAFVRQALVRALGRVGGLKHQIGALGGAQCLAHHRCSKDERTGTST